MLQYFRPSLSYHLSLRPLFCLFLSGRLRQVLLYLFLDILFMFTALVYKDGTKCIATSLFKSEIVNTTPD